MPFQKGNHLGKGGKRNPPGGRPTKEQATAKAEMRRAALELLTTGMVKAVETLLRHLSSKNENVSIRAAEGVIQYALRAYENQEIEEKLAALEARLEEKH
jgi:hypothetical protein